MCCAVCNCGRLQSIEDFTEAVIRLYIAYRGESPLFQNPAFRHRLQQRLVDFFSPPRKPGRPPSEEITLAAKLRAEGLPWNSVLREVVPNYANLHPAERTLERIKIQRAVYARRQVQKP